MSYFIKLRNWFTSQEHLLFLFALLFIVPNCVLFFTEPLPVTVGIASLILPYAFWVGLLLLARKPGIVVWCLLPKVILDGGQLVLLYLFGESVIAVDIPSRSRKIALFMGEQFIANSAAGCLVCPDEKEADKLFPKKMGGKKSRCVYTGDHSLYVSSDTRPYGFAEK